MTVVEEPRTKLPGLPHDEHEGPFHILRKQHRDGTGTYWCGIKARRGTELPSAEILPEHWCQSCVKAWRNRFKGWRGFLYAARFGR